MTNKMILMQRVTSDENIFLALYSVDSYIQNKELLSEADKKHLFTLRDKFDAHVINRWINSVKKHLLYILQDGGYLKTRIYFKPKKYAPESGPVFRPLHSSSLLDQICAVAMMNVLIYDIDDKKRISMSNLSHLIPHNFYGNRVAFEPENLFKPWQEQYKKYTSKANDLYKKYHDNLEYKWEVNLDLENFFPTINPISLINYINELLPVTYSEDDRVAINQILEKLIFVEVEDLSDKDLQRYTKKDNIKSCRFALGLAQGLPQSYFFANLFMVNIEQIYKKHIPGEMLFYVDDSAIFTNEIRDIEDFEEKIESINRDIAQWVKELYEIPNRYIISEEIKFTKDNLDVFEINIHKPGDKSTISNILDSKDGEIYIHCIGRQTSKTAFEINTSFSDEESRILSNKTASILSAIESELQKNDEKLSKSELQESEKKGIAAYKKKLVRYRKFFKYRSQDLAFRESTDVNRLREDLLNDFAFLNEKDIGAGLSEFFDKYNEDTLGATISFVLKAMREKELNAKDIIDKICMLNRKLFGYDNKVSSYLYKAYSNYIDDPDNLKMDEIDALNIIVNRYNKLGQIVKWKTRFSNKKTDGLRLEIVNDILSEPNYEGIIEKYMGTKYAESAILVIVNSVTLQRMVLNAIFSCLFKIEISDDVILQKNNRKISYFELRLLEVLRNRNFQKSHFNKIIGTLSDDEFSNSIDYSIMQVIGIFRTFIRNPLYIDNLILVHKYTCDIWKNGSKHLYFYTLHNQEHAVDLIQNSIKILRAIDYIDISRNDYYVLFIACYLHDISMVTLPDLDSIQMNGYDADKIYTDFVKELTGDKGMINLAKKEVLKLLKDYYMKLDGFYEAIVRNNHAKDSAAEIRSRVDLEFIDSSLREIVAEVSEAHGYNVNDIYMIKSQARSKLWSQKFTKIVLRLADLLDMSNYRVSRLILEHNLENMGETSRFHWLSHLVTSDYEIETKYYLDESKKKNFLQQESIIENIVLKVYVNMLQITGEKPAKCNNTNLSSIDGKNLLLECGQVCDGTKCNFLCKWFTKKNYYLFDELSALQTYLNNLPDNYFHSKISVCVVTTEKNLLSPKQFTMLKKYVSG